MLSRYLLTVAALACALFAAACGTLEQAIDRAPKPTARLLGADIRNLNLKSLDLVFDVEVSNPYDVRLPLVDLNYALGSGKRQLLAGGIKPSGSVPAKGSSVMQLPARLDLGSVLKTLTNVKPGSIVPYQANIDIVVDAPLLGELSVPLKHRGEIPIPAIPEVFVASIEVSELSLDQVNATARLWVTNTNEFQIDLSKLGFSLDLAGKRVATTGTKSKTKVPPGKSITVDVPLSFSPKSLGTGLFNLMFKDSAGYSIAGDLEVGTRYGPLTFPLRRQGETMLLR